MSRKLYKDDFTNARRLAWVRSKSQANYRGEKWNITFSEFCQFWNNEKRWNQRGRKIDALVLTRIDTKNEWNTANCCIIRRREQLLIKINMLYGKPYDQLFNEAINYGE